MLQQTSSPLAVAAPSMDSRYALAANDAMLCYTELHKKRQEYLAVKYTALVSVITHFWTCAWCACLLLCGAGCEQLWGCSSTC